MGALLGIVDDLRAIKRSMDKNQRRGVLGKLDLDRDGKKIDFANVSGRTKLSISANDRVVYNFRDGTDIIARLSPYDSLRFVNNTGTSLRLFVNESGNGTKVPDNSSVTLNFRQISSLEIVELDGNAVAAANYDMELEKLPITTDKLLRRNIL